MPDPTDEQSDDRTGADETLLAGTPVVVRRNAGLAAVIGAAASGIAIAYLWRAVDTGAPLDWALCLVLALIAGFYLAGLLDARTPLVVADDLGVRIRLGNQWRGLPWDAVAAVEVRPRRSPLHDGRLVFRPHSLGRALDGLEIRGRRHASLNQKMYGAALAVPLGLTTRTSAGSDMIAEGLAALSRGRAEVLEVLPEPAATAPDTAAEDVAGHDALVEDRTHDVPADLAPEATADAAAGPTDPTPASRRSWLAGLRRPAAGAPVDAQDAGLPTVEIDSDDSAEGTDAYGHDQTGQDAAGPHEADDRTARRSLLGGIGTIVSRVAKANAHDVDVDPHGEDTEATEHTGHTEVDGDSDTEDTDHDTNDAPVRPAASAVAPLRAARPALRAQVTRDTPATTLGAAALADDHSGSRRSGLPEGRELHRPGSVDLVFEPVETSTVRPIATLGDPVDPLVIDDFVTEPAYDPVIGPALAAARTRVGLTVDELAERTRIRPHVIESIEVDDFAPCGGDFYARGHLRTLARVLGQDPAPLLEQFDNRYATAPINARRVFEAELATGMTGTMRSTVGGPNWGLLVGAVLSLVLIWGLVRLFATEPPELIQDSTPVLNGSAGVDQAYPSAAEAKPASRLLPIMLVATQAGSRVVVHDGDGKVAFAGELVIGERKTLLVDPPVRVQAANSGAVEVRVKGMDRGPVGELGEPGRRTFHRPIR
ncbi:MAG: helix-turn-helix domain-containing protein [Nocardioides sp.]